MTATTLWDLFAAEQARDEGIQRAERNANDEWMDAAYQAVTACAYVACEFTADDVRRYMEMTFPHVQTHEPRAMGAVMRRAQRDGIIVPTDRFQNSAFKTKHCSPTRVWRTVNCDACGGAQA